MDENRLRRTGEAARAWGASRETVRLWCEAGRVAGAVRIGKHWRIPGDTIERVAKEGLPAGGDNE